MADSNSNLEHLLSTSVNFLTSSADLLARSVPGSAHLRPTLCGSSSLLPKSRHANLCVLHTRRVKEAEKDALRRAAKKKERDSDRRAKLEAVDRHAEKACLCPCVKHAPVLAKMHH